MTARHLDGTGKGVAKYDYSNDILLLKIKDRDYKKSIELDNLVVDFDSENFIYGLRIFDASKILEIPRESLRNIQKFDFKAMVEDNVVYIKLSFVAMLRNKELVRQGQDIVREAETEIQDSKMVCTIAWIFCGYFWEELGIQNISVNWVSQGEIKGDYDIQKVSELEAIIK